jgi:hypothetical protein
VRCIAGLLKDVPVKFEPGEFTVDKMGGILEEAAPACLTGPFPRGIACHGKPHRIFFHLIGHPAEDIIIGL